MNLHNLMLRGSAITRDVPDDTGGAPPPAPVAWHAGLDAEHLGHVQLKGWDKLDPAAATAAIVKAHREAERHIGVPADQILRRPKDAADAAGWDALHSALGRPADAAGYDLSTVKVGEAALDAATTAFLQTTAHALGLPADAGVRLASEFAKHTAATEAAAAAEFTATLEAEKTALKTDWGANFEGNKQLAAAAAAKLGVTPEAVAALEGTIGYKDTMNFFLKLSQASGEASFHGPGGGGDNSPLSYEMAVARKAELMRDAEFVKRYQSGDAAAGREFSTVIARIAAGL